MKNITREVEGFKNTQKVIKSIICEWSLSKYTPYTDGIQGTDTFHT